MYPKVTPRELYPLILDKQFNLITQMINKNVILKRNKPLQLQEKLIMRAFKITDPTKTGRDEEISDSDTSLHHKALLNKYRPLEKFLRVSDFIWFIMENKNLYSTTSNPESIFKQTIKFLRGMQYLIDFEKCARLLLLNNFHT